MWNGNQVLEVQMVAASNLAIQIQYHLMPRLFVGL